MLKPIGNKVIVEKQVAELKTTGGIIIPDNATEKPNKGKIVAVGEGTYNNQGTRVPLDCKVGDEIYYNKYSGTEVKLDNKDLVILEEKDILFVVG